jgi:DNA polymerase-3 subunit epsilon
MREICFDTETTGLDPNNGDRLLEIGAVELINHKPTGKIFHEYINPERDVPEEVVKVHGLNNAFLADKPKFAEIAQKWIEFVGDDGIFVAHNARFDMDFLNMELQKCGYPAYEWDRVVDTLAIARSEYPHMRNSLDALCKRFNVDNSARTFHGALLDAQLLSEVYLQLLGGDEPSMKFASATDKNSNTSKSNTNTVKIIERHFPVSEQEIQENKSFLEQNIKNSIWLQETAENK